MKRLLLGLGCAVGLGVLPNIASAALTLRLPDMTIDRNNITDDQRFIEAVFEETGANVNEDFFGYTIGVNIVPVLPATAGGVSFISPFGSKPVIARYVLQDSDSQSNPAIFGPGTNASSVQASDDTPGTEDITSGDGLIRLHLNYNPALLVPGTVYNLVFDPAAASFGDTVGNEVPVTFDNGQITIVPEPATMGLLALGGLLGLRRRRTA